MRGRDSVVLGGEMTGKGKGRMVRMRERRKDGIVPSDGQVAQIILE